MAKITITLRPDQQYDDSSPGFGVSDERTLHVEFPAEIREEHVGIAARDAELLSRIMRDQQGSMAELLNAVTKGDYSRASELASGIGLDEQRFSREGGNWVGAVLVGAAVVAAVLLWASDAE